MEYELCGGWRTTLDVWFHMIPRGHKAHIWQMVCIISIVYLEHEELDGLPVENFL